jgi:hypothetical protein
MSASMFDDFDYYHRPFDPVALISVIQQARKRFPDCHIGRAGNGIGNLCVYDSSGDYVGVIELHDPPEFMAFGEPRMNVEVVETALADAIDQWMRVPSAELKYHHGNAQGIARALTALRGTTFSVEWEAGLDRYQNRIVLGDDRGSDGR